MTSIEQFMDQKVVVLKSSDTVLTAARAMAESQVGCVVVAEKSGQIVGILTDRDIVCNLISTQLDAETHIEQVMETDLLVLEKDSNIEDAIRLMRQNGVRRLPIIEMTKKNESRCIGIVSLDDLIAGELATPSQLATIVKSQILRKRRPTGEGHAHSARSEQTYNVFVARVAKKLDIERKMAEEVIDYFTGSIVRRLHYSGGIQFVAQLPKVLQERLLELPAGPDRTITTETFIQGIALRTGRRPDEAAFIAYELWQLLKSSLGESHSVHLLHQLPEAIRDLLSTPQSVETLPLTAEP